MKASGEVELVNQQMLRYFRRTAAKLKDWSSFLHPDDRTRMTEQWRETIRLGEPYQVEHRLRRDDGAYRWFHCAGIPMYNADGSILRWYNLLRDIEERKQAEEALRASEQNLREIINHIPGSVCTANAAGELELINEQALQYTGVTAEEIKNWRTGGTLHPEDRPRVVEAWDQCDENRAAC
jgi:PAS domain S-box-containing protein